MNLTKEKFEIIPHGDIFSSGITIDNARGINMANTGKELLWVAVKGGGNDWAIYIHFSTYSKEEVKRHGDKVFNEHNIKKLIPCDNEVYSLYRF